MFKIKFIIALTGFILVLYGILSPWIFFYGYGEFFNGTEKINVRYDATISPFTLTFQFYVLPKNVLLTNGSYYFYDPLASLIGLSCIIGSILGFFGINIIRWKYTLIGITLIILSLFSFFLCIPKNISVLRFNLMTGWYITIFGGLIMILLIFPKIINKIYVFIHHPIL